MEPKRCYGCMKLKQNSPICEHCGYDERRTNGPHQLPVGTILQGKYLVGRVLGQGGFGITYLGRDIKLDIPVAIKEYYPTGMVSRESSVDCAVTVATDGEDTRFAENRDRFLREAQTLARLEDVSEVVQVKNFFEENNTAYIVMGYVRGITLKEHMRRSGGKLPAREVFRLLEPLMEALGQVHELGLVHRDISPDNIMLQPNGRARLIDFGAAHAATAAGDKSTQAVLKHGFAPPEQYQSKGILGPWTDVYAMCATVYHLLTGLQPPNITDLLMGEADFEWEALQGLTPGQLAALKQGLVTQYKKRIQSMDELCRRLFDEAGKVIAPTPIPESKPIPQPERKPQPAPQPRQAEPSVSETGTVALIREETEVHAIHTAPVVREQPVVTAPVVQAPAYTAPVQHQESDPAPVERDDAPAPVPVKEEANATPKTTKSGSVVREIFLLSAAIAVFMAVLFLVLLATGRRILVNPRVVWKEVSVGQDIWCEYDETANYAFNTHALRKEIASITFLDTTKDAPEGAVDASKYQDGSVLAWVFPNEESSNLYDLYLAADGGVVAPEDSGYLFERYSSLQKLDLSGLDTSKVTNMFCVFGGCENLAELDVSGLDTSKVTDMSGMFSGCRNLTELDVSGLDTSKVTDMSGMFSGCRNLTELDVSGFDTSKVTDMSYMFYGMSTLSNINGSFDVRNVVIYDEYMDPGDTFNGRPWEELFR